MNDMPLVAVVVPTLDRPEMIVRAVSSVQAQTHSRLEIIVVDDSPSGNAGAVVAPLAARDPRVRYVRNPGRGGNAARNHGIRVSDGEYVAFLDDDDEFAPEKIERQVGALQASGGQVSYCFPVLVDYTGSPEESRGTDYRPPGLAVKHPRVFLQAYNFVGTQTLVCTREAIDAVDGFDEDLPKWQDWDLVLRLSRKFALQCVPEPLVRIHKHHGERVNLGDNRHIDRLYCKHRRNLRSAGGLFLTTLYCARTANFGRLGTYLRCVWLPAGAGGFSATA